LILRRWVILSKFLLLLLFVFSLWILYTTSFEISELFLGLVVSIGISAAAYRLFPAKSIPSDFPLRILKFFVYLPVLIFKMITANIDVARRVLSPSLPIKPGLVELSLELNGNLSRLVLSNSITLTPGTLTLEVNTESNTVLVHVIDVGESPDKAKLALKIVKPFEKRIRGVFE